MRYIYHIEKYTWQNLSKYKLTCIMTFKKKKTNINNIHIKESRNQMDLIQ